MNDKKPDAYICQYTNCERLARYRASGQVPDLHGSVIIARVYCENHIAEEYSKWADEVTRI